MAFGVKEKKGRIVTDWISPRRKKPRCFLHLHDGREPEGGISGSFLARGLFKNSLVFSFQTDESVVLEIGIGKNVFSVGGRQGNEFSNRFSAGRARF